MRLTSLLFVFFFAGVTIARAAAPSDGRQIIQPDRVHYIQSPDRTVQLMGGWRWDFEVKTDNTKILIVDFGFGKSSWDGCGPFRHFYPRELKGRPVNVVTFIIIPDGSLFLGSPTKYKVIIALNGEADGDAYFGAYTAPEAYQCSVEHLLEAPPVDKNGLYRLSSAWVSRDPTKGEPDENLLLGFFESKK